MSAEEFLDELKYTTAELFVRDVEELFTNPKNKHYAFLNDMYNSSKDPRPGTMRPPILETAERWMAEGDTAESHYGWLVCEFALKPVAKAFAMSTEEGLKVDCCGLLCMFSRSSDPVGGDHVGLCYVREEAFNECELPQFTVEQIVEPFL